jgi:2-polyprenyl-3-methyl-5-hydroxy-6-metoxy-1,4-benzoquinol methylase
MNSEWYEEWFNNDDYQVVYKHRDKAEAENLKELVLNNIDRKKINSVLDMACGAGRHSISFALEGFKVTAVDLSENLLKSAKQNAEKENVKIEFILSDIRDFKPVNKFDLVLNLFTSIGYFETDKENIKVIKKAYDVLNTGGWFVLDYFNKNFILNNMIPITVENIGGRRITQIREIADNRVIKKINIKNNGKESEFIESVRLFSENEITDILQNIGFKIGRIFGDFDSSNFDIDNSPRLIVIVQR